MDGSTMVLGSAVAAFTEVRRSCRPTVISRLCPHVSLVATFSNVMQHLSAHGIQVCPNKFELLHPVYRKLCHLLADVDEWGQMAILAALQRYVRTQFTNPQPGSKDASGGDKGVQDSSKSSRKVTCTPSSLLMNESPFTCTRGGNTDCGLILVSQ